MARVEPKLEGAEQLEAVEKALTSFTLDKSFAPAAYADTRGIHELIAELEHTNMAQGALIKLIKSRLEHFDRLQSDFYNGKK